MIKTYFAEKKGINPSNIVSVSVNPCTAKKQKQNGKKQRRLVTTMTNPLAWTQIFPSQREFIRWIQEENLDFNAIEESQLMT